MPTRLLSILVALVAIACTPAVAAAESVSLPAVAGGHGALRFDSEGLRLTAVDGAHLVVGSSDVKLGTGRLTSAGAARTIVVEGASEAQPGHGSRARLVLNDRGRSLRDRAGSRGPVARRTVRLQVARHRHPAPGRTATPTATPTGTPTATPTPAAPPTASAPPTTTVATPTPSAPGSSPVIGINVGSAIQWELQFAQTLGARSVRMNFPIGTPTSQMDPIILAYAQAGIRADLLATFDGTIPTAGQDANLALWAQRYGPGGTFWAAHPGFAASLAVTDIEFGNESSYNYEYPQLASNPSWYATSSYASIAAAYGQAYVQAVGDVNAVNSGVRVLAVADSPGQVPQWLQGMFAGAPTLRNVVEGWIVHPYGNQWAADINQTMAQAQSLGAPSNVPVYVTEVGVSTDNGNCLDDNYGWNPCMTYAQAAVTLTTQVAGIEADLGSRLAQLDLYSARDCDATGTSDDREGYFGALQSQGQAKGAFTSAVEGLLASTAS